MDWPLIRVIVPSTIGFFLVGHGLYSWLSGRTGVRPAVETILVGTGVSLAFLPVSPGASRQALGVAVLAILVAAVSAAARRGAPAGSH